MNVVNLKPVLTASELSACHAAPMRSETAKVVIQAMQDRNLKTGVIQQAMIGHLASLATMERPKVVCVKDATLLSIFSANIRGKDAKMLATWIEVFTPIRVNFDKETGRFSKLGWSDQRVKERKEEGVALFDVEGAKEVLWTEVDPKTGKRKATPEISRALKVLFRELARGIDVGVFSQTEGVRMAREALDAPDDWLEKARMEAKHGDFVEQFNKERDARKRAGVEG